MTERQRQAWLRLAAVGLTGVLTAAVTIGPANGAWAAVPGLQVIYATSNADSLASKEISITCPAGQSPLSAGADILDGGPDVVVDDMTVGASTVTAKAYEDQDGTNVSWQIRVYAICAVPLPSQQIVTAVTAKDDVAAKSITAVCPAGTVVIGTGGRIAGGLGQVVLDEVRPLSNNTEVHAFAFADQDGTDGAAWDLKVFGVCAAQPVGYTVVTAGSVSNSSNKGMDAVCPAGTSPTGGGFEITGGLGQTFAERLWYDTTSVHAGGREDDDGNAGNWDIRTTAICATP